MPKKILIVEDHQDIREELALVLSLEDYSVIEAENGMAALQFIAKEIPDLIISNITMPVLDGFGLYYNLKQNPETSDIPFIFLSASNENLKKCRDMGNMIYLAKPYATEKLLEIVKTSFNMAENQIKSINRIL
jgi:CheY-like chemotaxis protein